MTNRHLVETLRDTVAEHGDRPAVFWRIGASWHSLTYTQMLEQVEGVASGLLGLGLQHGDRVALFSQNRPEWAIADFATLSVGAVTVPIYATNTADQVAYILNQSGSRLVFVGEDDQAATVASIRDRCPQLEYVVVLAGKGDPDRLMFAELRQEGRSAERAAELRARRNALRSDDLASIIYTSGTTGEPKGVMLSHTNFAHQLAAIDEFFDVGPDDRSLCFLPLSHVYERTWSYYVFSRGARNYYLSNPRAVVDYLPEVRPTAMVSVPRLYEKVYAGVMSRAESASRLRRRLFDWALDVGGRYARTLEAGETPALGLRLSHRVADRLVLSKIREVVGGPKNFFSAGGAPLSATIEEFFLAAGLLVCQGYGLTETSPMVTCNSPGKYRFGTVGHPVPGCEIRIADDGEVLVRGANVMQGYYDNPEATAAVLRDGWLHTGDVGHIDEDGFLAITDRLKDIIITSGGKNIAPQRIETAIGRDHFIEQIAAIGDRRKFVSALVVPAFDVLEGWANENGIEYGSRRELVAHPEVIALYRRRIDLQSTDLAGFESVKAFTLLEREFSQDGSEITPTQKIRRRIVEKSFAAEIEAMYAAAR
ncbi:MAG: long-chain fatty acid--CoA ligase [Acidimicrobiia bacterium]|nr:long-chain fatty acid--CoA ligase [Acidimicrobiia bacterium]